MTEKYVVSLIMEGHDAAPTEIGVLGKEGLYHPEKWIREQTHVKKIERTWNNKTLERGQEATFHLKKGISSPITFQHDDQGV